MVPFIQYKSFDFLITDFIPTDISGCIHWSESDDSGGRHSVVAAGDCSITTGVADPFGDSNGVISLDGTGDRLDIPDSDDWPQGTNDFTIELCFKTANTGATQMVMTQWGDGGSNGSFAITIYPTINQIGFFFSSNGASETSNLFSWTANTNWNNVAFVRDGETLRFFHDGTQLGTYAIGTTSIYNSTRDMNIGAYKSAGLYFNGYISNVRISNNARYTGTYTPTTSLFENDSNTVFLLHGTGYNTSTIFSDYSTPDDTNTIASMKDKSGEYNHVTQSITANMPTYQTNELNSLPIIRFDGSSDVLSCTLSQAQPITVYTVVKATAGTSVQGILGDSNVYLSLTADEYLNLYAGSNITGSTDVSGSYKIFSAVINNTSSEIFSNTTSQATGTAGSGSLSTLNIGSNGTNYLTGDIAETIMYSGANSSSDQSKVRNYLKTKYSLY